MILKLGPAVLLLYHKHKPWYQFLLIKATWMPNNEGIVNYFEYINLMNDCNNSNWCITFFISVNIAFSVLFTISLAKIKVELLGHMKIFIF